MIKIIEGNIFSTNSQTLVNTVNCEGYMGRGVALEFRLRYPKMFEEYAESCRNKKLTIGKLFMYDKESPSILCFPTKNYYKLNSKVEYIEQGLEEFVKNYHMLDIKSVTFPMLGASNGKLDAKLSLEIMRRYLEPINDIDIIIVKKFIKSKDPDLERFLLYVKKSDKPNDISASSWNRLKAIVNEQESKIHSLSDLLNMKISTLMPDGSVNNKGVTDQTISKSYQAWKDNRNLWVQQKFDF